MEMEWFPKMRISFYNKNKMYHKIIHFFLNFLNETWKNSMIFYKIGFEKNMNIFSNNLTMSSKN